MGLIWRRLQVERDQGFGINEGKSLTGIIRRLFSNYVVSKVLRLCCHLFECVDDFKPPGIFLQHFLNCFRLYELWPF